MKNRLLTITIVFVLACTSQIVHATPINSILDFSPDAITLDLDDFGQFASAGITVTNTSGTPAEFMVDYTTGWFIPEVTGNMHAPLSAGNISGLADSGLLFCFNVPVIEIGVSLGNVAGLHGPASSVTLIGYNDIGQELERITSANFPEVDNIDDFNATADFIGLSVGSGIHEVLLVADTPNSDWLEGEDYVFDNFTFTSVPEPATMLLLGTGLIGLAAFRRRFRKRDTITG